jgi:hypothetical protein
VAATSFEVCSVSLIPAGARPTRSLPLARAGTYCLATIVLIAGLTVGRNLGRFLIVTETPVPADATLITYSANSFARPAVRLQVLGEAAARFASGLGPHILLSELDLGDGAFQTRIELARERLLKAGVPDEAIEKLPSVSNEREEAAALQRAVAGRGWRRIVAYAPEVRARRTAGALRRAGDAVGVDVRLVALRDPDVPLQCWWCSWHAASAVLGEYPKLVYYALRPD